MIAQWPMTEMKNEMNRLQGEINRLFSRQGNGYQSARSYPAMNMWENGEHFVVEAELPGMDLGDIEIFVDGGNQLTVKGEREAVAEETGTWHRRERGFGKFNRTIVLPANVDAERVEAVLRNGVLIITLPRPEECKPRKITVKAM